jgi:hypothetical protein
VGPGVGVSFRSWWLETIDGKGVEATFEPIAKIEEQISPPIGEKVTTFLYSVTGSVKVHDRKVRTKPTSGRG